MANSRQPQQVEFDSEVEGDLKLSVANPNLLKLAYQDHKLNKANPTLALDQANLESSEAESKLANAQQTKNAPPIIKGKVMGLTFNVLLDPCSTGSEGYIINYVHTDVVHKLEEQEKLTKKKALKKCTCLRATTCTAAGCFETSSCKTMYIKLFDDNKTLGEEKISFRVAKGIQHDMIIGNHTFRSLDLSKEFRHLFAPIEEIKEVAVNTTDSPTEVKQVMEK